MVTSNGSSVYNFRFYLFLFIVPGLASCLDIGLDVNDIMLPFVLLGSRVNLSLGVDTSSSLESYVRLFLDIFNITVCLSLNMSSVECRPSISDVISFL